MIVVALGRPQRRMAQNTHRDADVFWVLDRDRGGGAISKSMHGYPISKPVFRQLLEAA
jgi:hypothetical protein